MAKSDRDSSDVLGDAEENTKTVAKAGPAGVLLVAMIILAVIAILVLGVMLLGSPG